MSWNHVLENLGVYVQGRLPILGWAGSQLYCLQNTRAINNGSGQVWFRYHP